MELHEDLMLCLCSLDYRVMFLFNRSLACLNWHCTKNNWGKRSESLPTYCNFYVCMCVCHRPVSEDSVTPPPHPLTLNPRIQ